MKKVLIFESTRAVIKAEQLIRKNEIECRIIPVPRSVSPQCGMAVETGDESLEKVSGLLEKAGLPVQIFDRSSLKL